MQRFLLASFVGFALATVVVPVSHATAAPGGGGGGGGSHKHKGKGKSGPSTSQIPTGAAKVISGAGQRLHFSFGGKLQLHGTTNQLTGKFSIIVHPSSPTGSSLNITCRYNEFSAATISGNTIEFDGRGQCLRLATDGTLTKVKADNHFTIVDNPGGTDSIDVEFNGAGGIAIPGGQLSFGGFTVATAS